MRKQAKNKLTFKQIVDEVAQGNFRILMDKARQFSRLAKVVHGHGRQVAYFQKNMCLKQILQKNPEARIDRDWQAKDHELLSVCFGLEYPLHTKRQWLSEVA